MRKCDGCTLCCKLLECSALEKPRNVTCQFCEWNVGCTIYKNAPQMCHDFYCEWLTGTLPEWMYPKDLGIVVEKLSDKAVLVSAEEKDWCNAKIEEELKRIYQDNGIAVIDGKTGRSLLPEGMSAFDLREEVNQVAEKMGALRKNDST